MINRRATVEELYFALGRIMADGGAGKTVKLSVNFDHCDHIQRLTNVCHLKELDWITLTGGRD